MWKDTLAMSGGAGKALNRQSSWSRAGKDDLMYVKAKAVGLARTVEAIDKETIWGGERIRRDVGGVG